LAGKEDRRVQKMCTHACKCKNDTCWKYSRNWGRGNKREWWNLSMIYLINCNNLCKSHNVLLPNTTIKEIKKNEYRKK
jgi:hypothetical protein